MAIRVCSAYKTVSLDAATLLARTPPFDLLAAERKAIFDRCLDARIKDFLDVETTRRIRSEERLRLSGL